MISERVPDIYEVICLCFIIFQRAFDPVDWTKQLEIDTNIGVNWTYSQFVHGTKMKLRLNQGETASVKIGGGDGMIYITHII